MSKSELEKEWLFGNSIISLVGAFLWGTAWRPSSGEYTYPIINVSVSTDLDIIFVPIGAFLIFAALFFAFTSVAPYLRNCASTLAIYCSPVLKILTLAGFIVTWGAAAVELPEDQWWTEYLMIVGILFLPIILLKMFQDFHRWSSRDSSDSSKSADTEISGEEPRSGGLLLGSTIMAVFILIGVSRPALLRLWQRISSRWHRL
ncbi:MAG: hypothetical protein OXC95_13680 [Dehalococcoidia bacterium]|nr:hypothetical protein [Dehalococcoidia bacterium]